RLAQVDAGVVGGRKITRHVGAGRIRNVLEDSFPVERLREQVADDALNVEVAPVAHEVVMRESRLELKKVDGVESKAQTSFARRRLDDADDHDLCRIRGGDVDRRARVD